MFNGILFGLAILLTLQSTVAQTSCTISTQSNTTPVACKGDANGAATVAGTGGTAPYSYQWSNGATTAAVSGLTAGNYQVTVTDAAACIAFATVTITEPLALSATTAVSNTICNGAVGAIQLNPIGGTAPFSYLWADGSTAATAGSLPAGLYQATVTDANACFAAVSATVGITAMTIQTAVSNLSSSNCSTATGTVTVSPANGTSPYSFQWNSGHTAATINNAAPGTYSITITDANGCTGSQSNIIIAQNTIPLAGISNFGDVICNGAANGWAKAEAKGGVAPYTYNWSTGATVPNVVNFRAGVYTVTVTDANGCTSTAASVTISEPSAISASFIVTDASTAGAVDGAIDASITGGVAPYTFAWSNGELNEDIIDLAAGSYTLTTTDANGCTQVFNQTVQGGPVAVWTTENANIQVYPNPTQNNINIDFTQEVTNSEIRLYNVEGQLLQSFTFTTGTQINISLAAFTSGVYVLEIVNASGKKTTQRIVKY